MKQSSKDKPHFKLYEKLEKCVNQRLLESLQILRQKTELLTIKIKSKSHETANN